MNGDRRQARRYHWLSEGLRSFVDEPHEAIDGVAQGTIVSLTIGARNPRDGDSSTFSATSDQTGSSGSW